MLFNFRIFRLFGSDVHLHSTFFLFGAFFLFANAGSRGWDAVPLLGLYYLSAFASVLAHEYGHVFIARFHGIDCRRITLHGLGGLAHLDDAPNRPRDEFLIALAGPATSILLAGVIWSASIVAPTAATEQFLYGIAFINLIIAAFNMVPAYPLDGGQMLHAVLRRFLSREMAARVASGVAQVLGAVLVGMGWHLGSMNMMLIGVALFFLTPPMLGRRRPTKVTGT